MRLPILPLLYFLHTTNAIAAQPEQQRLNDNSIIPALPATTATKENQDLFSLHRSLVEIDSVSGKENAIGLWLEAYLTNLNYTVEKHALSPLPSNPHNATRYNIFAYPSAASSRKTRILLTSHIDTVPPFTNYSTTHDADNNLLIHGRGSNDAKASVAAQITALTSLLAVGTISASDAALLFVCGEEVHGDGMKSFSASHSPGYEAVIFGEPTENKLVAGHKGIILFDVEAVGKDAHSGYPWLGQNAIEMIIPALGAVRDLRLPGSELLGPSTVNIGLVSGGAAGNVVPAHAAFSAAARLGGGTAKGAKIMVFRRLMQVDHRLKVSFSSNGYGPVKCDTDIAGFETTTVNYGTDVPNLEGGHKRYLYGPGSILTAHSDHEEMAAAELVEAVDGYKRLVLGALENGKGGRDGGEGNGDVRERNWDL